MIEKISKNYFIQKTEFVAKDILGDFLCRKIGDEIVKARIVETEAYFGKNDPASHARFGNTKRTRLMFEKGGKLYIYLIYGMYYCLNFTTDVKNEPGAILIRAVEPVQNTQILKQFRNIDGPKLTNGPGKLCQALNINSELNGLDVENKLLYIEKNEKKDFQIESSKRIGIKNDLNENCRFFISDNKFLSR